MELKFAILKTNAEEEMDQILGRIDGKILPSGFGFTVPSGTESEFESSSAVLVVCSDFAIA